MISAKTIENSVYNSLKGVNLEGLKALRKETLEAIEGREAMITEATEDMSNSVDEIVERHYVRKLRYYNECHRVLSARLKGIEKLIGEEETEEEEEEEFTGFTVPSVPDSVMFM